MQQSFPYLERILVKERSATQLVAVDSIDYIEAADDYVAIHAGGRVLIKTQRLSELEQQLDPKRFLRIHRSTILRLGAMASIERNGKDSIQARLHTGATLNVSRSGYERLKLQLKAD